MPNSAMLDDTELEAAATKAYEIADAVTNNFEIQALIAGNLIHYIIRRMEKEKNG